MLHKMQVFTVHANDSEMSQGQPEWAYSDKDTAKLASLGNGWWGGDAPTSEQLAIIDDKTKECFIVSKVCILDVGPMYKTKEELIDVLKTRALNKLTTEERKLLNLE